MTSDLEPDFLLKWQLAVETLSRESSVQEVLRLNNAIVHLERSNRDLQNEAKHSSDPKDKEYYLDVVSENKQFIKFLNEKIRIVERHLSELRQYDAFDMKPIKEEIRVIAGEESSESKERGIKEAGDDKKVVHRVKGEGQGGGELINSDNVDDIKKIKSEPEEASSSKPRPKEPQEGEEEGIYL